MAKSRKRRNHKTTKNTVTKPPVTKLAEYTLDINGVFTLVTDITDGKVFDKLYREWFDDPSTVRWCGDSLGAYIKNKLPNCICLMKEDYLKMTKGKVTPATEEEWKSENN